MTFLFKNILFVALISLPYMTSARSLKSTMSHVQNEVQVFLGTHNNSESSTILDHTYSIDLKTIEDYQMLLQKKEIALHKAESENAALKVTLLLIGLAGFSFLVFVGFNYYRKRIRLRQLKVEEDKRRIKVYSDEKIINISDYPRIQTGRVQNSKRLNSRIDKILETEKEAKNKVISLKKAISENQELEKWENFKSEFDNTYPHFLTNLRTLHPTLTEKEVQIAIYTLLKFPSKKISILLHIAPPSVDQAKYRLKKKLKIESVLDLEQYLRGVNTG